MKQISLLIADEPSMVRKGIKHLLEEEEYVRQIWKADNEEECLQLLSEKKPDLLILDISLTKETGFDIIKKINEKKSGNIKVLILTFHKEIDYLINAIETGIDGYILKNSTYEELQKAIITVLDGNKYIQADLLKNLKLQMQNNKNDIDKINNLTQRELDVLKHLSTGMYNKEIALKLDISERTVKNHVFNIFKKIGVADRTQAAVFAIRNHLININD